MLARIINGQTIPWDGKPFEHPLHPEWGVEWKPCSPELWSPQELDNAGFVLVPDPPAPSPPIPSIQLWQARAILTKRGLFAAINAYVESHKDDNPELYQAWNYGNEVHREGLFVTSLSNQFSLTTEQVDQLFIDGNELNA